MPDHACCCWLLKLCVSCSVQGMSMVSPFMSLGSLEDCLQKGSDEVKRHFASERGRLQCALDCALGVKHLHEQGVLHNDRECALPAVSAMCL